MDDPAAFAKLIAREVAAELADGYATGRYAPPSEYLTTEQAAAFLGLMPGGMETMRKEGARPVLCPRVPEAGALPRCRPAPLDGAAPRAGCQ